MTKEVMENLTNALQEVKVLTEKEGKACEYVVLIASSADREDEIHFTSSNYCTDEFIIQAILHYVEGANNSGDLGLKLFMALGDRVVPPNFHFLPSRPL